MNKRQFIKNIVIAGALIAVPAAAAEYTLTEEGYISLLIKALPVGKSITVTRISKKQFKITGDIE
jgi:hypothetical protein